MGKLAKILGKIDDALDMRHAARMERAKEMGFDTSQTYYHGTKEDIKGFKGTTFLTDNPELAKTYSGKSGSVYPVHIKQDAEVIKDMEGGSWRQDGLTTDDIAHDLFQDGADSVRFKDINDVGENAFHFADQSKGYKEFRESEAEILKKLSSENVLAIKDPSNIRSVNAAFDPAKKDSSNLLAGLGAAGIVGGSVLGSQESEAGVLGKLAKKAASHLDVSEAARLARAKEMGFHENTLYHGTAAKPTTTTSDGNIFDEFKLWEGEDPTRSTVRSPVSKLGVSLAEQPEVAQDFASLASQNGIDGSAVLPLRFRSENAGTIDLVGDESNEDIFGAVADSWQQGFDAIQFKNYTTPQGGKGSFVLVKDPSQIRSVNAAFDPAKKNSSNLLAGLGGAGILGASMLTPEQAAAADSFAAQDNDGIYADEFPTLEKIGGYLEKVETPIPLFQKPLYGLGTYLRRLGEPRSLNQRIMEAIDAPPI